MNNELSVKSDTNIMLFDDGKLTQLMKFADFMSGSGLAIPQHLQGKPADCFAIAMQAVQWGMDPFAVARKTYFVNHAISFEAQLVNAAVSSSRAIKGGFKYKYDGDWEKIVGTKPLTKDGWGDKEQGLCISVGAILAGEEEITWGEPVYLASVQTRNSPLWKNHVKQQISYLAVNMWARMYTPAVILGVYTPEEVEARDITPTTQTEDDNNEKINRHKANIEAGKKKQAPIESTAEEVTEEPEKKQEAEPKPEKKSEKKKPLMRLSDFAKKLLETTTPEGMAEMKVMGASFSGKRRAEAVQLYKERNSYLKSKVVEESTEEAEQEPHPMDEAYRMLETVKTFDDMDVVNDFVLSLNQERKITKEDIDKFYVAAEKVHDSISGAD